MFYRDKIHEIHKMFMLVKQVKVWKAVWPSQLLDGFGGLVVSMLASGTQVCGFKPGQSRWIFQA